MKRLRVWWGLALLLPLAAHGCKQAPLVLPQAVGAAAATPAPPSGPTLAPARRAEAPREREPAATAALPTVTATLPLANTPADTATLPPAETATARPASAVVTASATASPQPTATTVTSSLPVPTAPAPPLTPAVRLVEPATTYETTVTISTYEYEAGFIPTLPEDPVHPYPRLDFSRVGPPTAVTYRAIVLENAYVRLKILPELGGRLYSWLDKTTGRELLYQNPVVKPTAWGYRQWWLAAGGIEWAFPVKEHGLNEYLPWQASTTRTGNGVAATMSSVELRSGMSVGVTVSLGDGEAFMTLQPWARNDTGVAHDYQLWLNAMLAPGGNHVSPETRIIVPAGQALIHSSGDGRVPPSGASISWPIHQGADLSRYGNWQGYLGFFVPAPAAGFTALYDPTADQGIVRAFSPGAPAGTKIFGPATLSPAYWTDDDSNYIELWSGATATFWHYNSLQPGQSAGWTEYWYPVHGLGDLTYANRAAALRLAETADGAALGVATSRPVDGRLLLFVGGVEREQWAVQVTPFAPFQTTWVRPAGAEGNLGLRLVDNDGSTLAEIGETP